MSFLEAACQMSFNNCNTTFSDFLRQHAKCKGYLPRNQQMRFFNLQIGTLDSLEHKIEEAQRGLVNNVNARNELYTASTSDYTYFALLFVFISDVFVAFFWLLFFIVDVSTIGGTAEAQALAVSQITLKCLSGFPRPKLSTLLRAI
jgi:hypothetical protein